MILILRWVVLSRGSGVGQQLPHSFSYMVMHLFGHVWIPVTLPLVHGPPSDGARDGWDASE